MGSSHDKRVKKLIDQLARVNICAGTASTIIVLNNGLSGPKMVADEINISLLVLAQHGIVTAQERPVAHKRWGRIVDWQATSMIE